MSIYTDDEIAAQLRAAGYERGAEAIERLAAEVKRLKKERDKARADLKIHEHAIPARCPITGERFFMLIEHPERGWVATYGGPYDSYTIPRVDESEDRPLHRRDLVRERYDHDEGGWSEWREVVDQRLIEEDDLNEFDRAVDRLAAFRKAAGLDEGEAT